MNLDWTHDLQYYSTDFKKWMTVSHSRCEKDLERVMQWLKYVHPDREWRIWEKKGGAP